MSKHPVRDATRTASYQLDDLELHKQYLATLSAVTTLLLENGSEQNWTEVLRLLAETTRIDNCALFINQLGEEGRLCAKLRSTWSYSAAQSRLTDFSLFRELYYDDFPVLSDSLHVGMVFARKVIELPPAEYRLFSQQDIVSVLCIPLLVSGELEGFIGFFSQQPNRVLLPMEVSALCAIANGFALALARERSEAAMLSNTTRLRALVGATEDLVIEYDVNGTILNLWTDNTQTFLSDVDIIGQTLEHALPPDMAQSLKLATPNVLTNNTREDIEFTLASGTEDRYFMGRLQALPTQSGQGRNVVALVRDVTDLMHEETKRQTMLETLDLLEEAIVDLSLDGHLINASAAWKQLLGDAYVAKVDAQEQLLSQFLHVEDRLLFDSVVKMLASGDKAAEVVRFRLEQRAHEPIWVEARLLAHRSPQGHITGLRGILRDITSSYLQEKRITQMALHDGLTQLPNRILLEEHLSQSIARAQRNSTKVALGFIDLDHFKHINDTLGHKAGDIVLVTLSKRLQSVLREMDTLSRWGGDEFVVLLPDTINESDIRIIAERLRDVARQSIYINGTETKLTISLGFAIYPNDADSAETLMSVADHTMFHAKSIVRNNVQFFQDIHDKSLDRENVLLQTKLNRAVQDRILQVFYQPIVDTSQNKIVAFEALARWHDDENGWISPDVFIPMAEHLGIVHELGEQIFDHALHRLKVWRELGHTVRVAVNITRAQLFAPHFVRDLRIKLTSYALTPQDMILEITENIALLDISYESKRLKELSEAGFLIAIDDFGTGQSALSQLHQMSVDMLKIDSSFAARLDTENGRRIVQAIVQMANALQLGMIVKGVQDEETANYLKSLGVAQMQGDFLSDAVPAGVCEMLMQ